MRYIHETPDLLEEAFSTILNRSSNAGGVGASVLYDFFTDELNILDQAPDVFRVYLTVTRHGGNRSWTVGIVHYTLRGEVVSSDCCYVDRSHISDDITEMVLPQKGESAIHFFDPDDFRNFISSLEIAAL